MFIHAILLVGSFGWLNAVPRTCNTTDYCLPVPADFCDKSLCQPFDIDQLELLGNKGVKSVTWIIGQEVYLAHCPLRFRMDKSINYDGTHSANAVFLMDSGAYCNITYGTTTMSFIGVPDPYTGKFHAMNIIQAGQTYEACFTYLEPMSAYVYRTCRVDPPPEKGQACANIYAKEISTGDYNKGRYLKFLQSLQYDFQEEEVQCVNEHTIYYDNYA